MDQQELRDANYKSVLQTSVLFKLNLISVNTHSLPTFSGSVIIYQTQVQLADQSVKYEGFEHIETIRTP